MKITLSFENSASDDISIMVDALRASTTIIAGLSNFNMIIPAFTEKEAIIASKKYNGVLAGERNGKKIEGFDVGNSPEEVENYKSKKNVLILTTSNGTRVLKNINSTVLIGSFINAKYVAKTALEKSDKQIDIVMAGWKGNFTIEDFLGSGEILYWLKYYSKNYKQNIEFSEYAQSAILASRNENKVKKVIYESFSANRLIKLNSKKDIDYCLNKNINNNVGMYKKGIIQKI